MLEKLAIVFVLTFCVRVYSSIAGGGRLALLPILTVLVGLEPSAALATMKCGGISSASSIIKFHRHGQVKWNLWKKITPFLLVGSIIGSFLVINIDQGLFKKLLSVSIFISLLILLVFKKKMKKSKCSEKVEKPITLKACGLAGLAGVLGALFGFKGAILRYYYVSRGLTFLEATATNKATGFIGKLASIIIFALSGLVDWPIAATMFVAGALGAWVGTSLGIKIGSVWVERIFAVVVMTGIVMMFLQR